MVRTDKRFLERSEVTEASIQQVYADATNKRLSPQLRAVDLKVSRLQAILGRFAVRGVRSRNPALRFLPGRLRLPHVPDKLLRRRLPAWAE